ncbi:MAG: carbohydrate ABC transporter permease [Glaciimonas sp.]|nr:carbohydrate ABC transporter permease [Glaciimonas sp.]
MSTIGTPKNISVITTSITPSVRIPSPSRSADVVWRALDTAGAWMLAIIWIAPLLFAFWAAFHHADAALRFEWQAAWVGDNFVQAWHAAPWLRYFLNTFLLVGLILGGQLILCTLAGFAFARFAFPGKSIVFLLVLLQLFILPEILIVENYAMVSRLGLFDTLFGIGVPYMASAFGIFLLRQTFKQVPKELEEAARIEGCGWFGVLWKVYVPAAKPVYLAYALVSVSTHWNNFLWPLIVTNSVSSRPLTVGLSLFGAPESGVNISLISAATLITIAPLLIGFLVFQRQFIQAFLRSGIK